MLLRSNSPWRPAPRSGGKNSPGDCFSGRGRFPGFRSAVRRTVKRSPALYGSPCEKERSEKNALFLFSEILPMIGRYSILEIRQKKPSPPLLHQKRGLFVKRYSGGWAVFRSAHVLYCWGSFCGLSSKNSHQSSAPQAIRSSTRLRFPFSKHLSPSRYTPRLRARWT